MSLLNCIVGTLNPSPMNVFVKNNQDPTYVENNWLLESTKGRFTYETESL